MMTNNFSKSGQDGLALISVLLIFAIVSVLATAMIERQSLDIQRSGNMQALQQARAYSSGIEYAVRSGLRLDYDNNPKVDHLSEEWAQPRNYPLQPGMAEIQIIDAQSRFNLNGLHKTATNRPAQIDRFKNLLKELGLDPKIADHTQKFMDEDSMVDNDYLGAEVPYRASYALFKHPSELLLVQEVDADTYRKLSPYITVLPVAATVNVNTASNKILAALSTQLSLSDADTIIGKRGKGGFENIDDFWSLTEVRPFTAASNSDEGGSGNQNTKEVWDKADFSVNSQYFEVFAKVTLAERVATIEMLIYRDNQSGEMRTYYRDYSRTEARLPVTNNSNTTPGSGGI
ncbi:MAG: general secretion pathway protein K [Oleispira sp.]|jgi:general secretion pathway protein K